MKNGFLFFGVVCAILVNFTSISLGYCRPSNHVFISQTRNVTSCPSEQTQTGVTVTRTWAIQWSDSATTSESLWGLGACRVDYYCDPDFIDQPYVDNGSSGAFKVRVTNKNQPSLLTCVNDLTVTKGVTHNCASTAGTCNGQPDYGQYPTTGCASGFTVSGGYCTRSTTFMNRCDRFGGYDSDSCNCAGGCGDSGSCSPIVVDVSGNGFSLTNASNGVQFDIDNDGSNETLAWTKIDTDDAWLALDRNGDGVISGGRELFGNATPQPPPPTGEELNGFLALAEFDRIYNGGNEDGKINRQDMMFANLRLWRDTNHNGISDAGELFTLDDLDVRAIDLDYKQSRRTDEHGNQFKYRAKVRDRRNASVGRWAWDVFLRLQP